MSRRRSAASTRSRSSSSGRCTTRAPASRSRPATPVPASPRPSTQWFLAEAPPELLRPVPAARTTRRRIRPTSVSPTCGRTAPPSSRRGRWRRPPDHDLRRERGPGPGRHAVVDGRRVAECGRGCAERAMCCRRPAAGRSPQPRPADRRRRRAGASATARSATRRSTPRPTPDRNSTASAASVRVTLLFDDGTARSPGRSRCRPTRASTCRRCRVPGRRGKASGRSSIALARRPCPSSWSGRCTRTPRASSGRRVPTRWARRFRRPRCSPKAYHRHAGSTVAGRRFPRRSEAQTMDERQGHAPWVRASHWIGAASLLVLAVTGVMILMVHPRLYWGEAGNDLTPALIELPISRNHQHGGWDAPKPFFPRAGATVSASGPSTSSTRRLGTQLHCWPRVPGHPGVLYLLGGCRRSIRAQLWRERPSSRRAWSGARRRQCASACRRGGGPR